MLTENTTIGALNNDIADYTTTGGLYPRHDNN